MKAPIDVTLTGSDGPVEGIAKVIGHDGYKNAYEFLSTDETLHLIIAQDANGQWHRMGGSDPYFSGWIDELAEQVSVVK